MLLRFDLQCRLLLVPEQRYQVPGGQVGWVVPHPVPDASTSNASTSDTKADTNADTKADTTTDTIADTKADTTTDTIADTTADTPADTGANAAGADAEPNTKPHAGADAKPHSGADAEPHTKPHTGADAEPDIKPHAGADARLAAGRVRACRVGSVHLWCSRTVCPGVPELLHRPVQLSSTRAVQRVPELCATDTRADTAPDTCTAGRRSASPTSGNVQRQQHRYLLRWGGLFQRLCLQ